MKIELRRIISDENATVGVLYLDGRPQCFTLEDPERTRKILGKTAIPTGTYELALRYSPKFTPSLGHQLLWLKNVPDFRFIMIHPGNTPDHTSGCILLGAAVSLTKGCYGLSDSKKAYIAAYNIISPLVSQNSPLVIHISSENPLQQ